MGRRSEQRIAACLPVIVRGIDSNGKPFTQHAFTHDVSASGARLEGLVGIDRRGSEFQIEYQGRKAHFRVQWVGPVGTRIAGLVGVRCIEEGKYIWGIRLGDSAPDDYDPRHPHAPDSPAAVLANSNAIAAGAYPETPRWAGNERRQFPRVSCRIEARVASAGTTLFLPATVTDICLGGCYLEMLSPLPLDSEVELLLGSGDEAIRSRGRVRSALPGMGMGVSFTGMGPDDLRRLRRIAPPLPDAPGSSTPQSPLPGANPPRSFASAASNDSSAGIHPRSTKVPENGARDAPANGDSGDFAIASLPQFPPTTAEALEAVVRVLFRKGILNSAELSAELQRLKASRS